MSVLRLHLQVIKHAQQRYGYGISQVPTVVGSCVGCSFAYG